MFYQISHHCENGIMQPSKNFFVFASRENM